MILRGGAGMAAEVKRRFLGSLQFLTVLPLRGETASPGQSAVFFPVTGALLGASSGAVFLAFANGLGRPLSALVALAWLLAITGCLHEDGLADVADAVRAGRTREKMMAILKDSRIGAYGALALIVAVAMRWQALAQINVNAVLGMAAAVALSRTSLVALAGIAPAAGEGLAVDFAQCCSRAVVLFTVSQAVVIALLVDLRYGAAMLLASALIVLLARAYFLRRLGGLNGDCLGAACLAVETANMAILAWHRSS
jgi:adenosylcobinamide-GDP ribazoletransferase